MSGKREKSFCRKKEGKMRFWKNCLLLGLLFALIHFWIKTKSYIFDEKAIVRVVNQYLGSHGHRQFQRIISSLEEQYPGHIVPKQYRHWVMYKCAGWIGSTAVLHSSLTESVVLSGTTLDTQGHSGRHWANITFVLLSGSIKVWNEGTTYATEHLPGDKFTIISGHASSLQWKADTWVLQYSRGFLPLSFGHAAADMLFSSVDLIGILKLCRAFGLAYYQELKNDIATFIASI